MRATPLLGLMLLVAACSSGSQADGDSPSPTTGPATLEVENRAFSDMTMYVLDGVQRRRLGVVTGNSTTHFTIPDYLIRGGSAPLRFLADPIGGQRLPVTESIVVVPGDTVQITIPVN